MRFFRYYSKSAKKEEKNGIIALLSFHFYSRAIAILDNKSVENNVTFFFLCREDVANFQLGLFVYEQSEFLSMSFMDL